MRSSKIKCWLLPTFVGISVVACNDSLSERTAFAVPAIVGMVNAALPAVVRIRGRGDLAQGEGSGFFIKGPQGRPLIVTNYHVVWGAEELNIERADGSIDTATVATSDPEVDLALLLPRSNAAPRTLSFGDDSDLRTGDWLLSVGSPAGIYNAVGLGVLSARSRVPGATIAAQRFVDHIFSQSALGAGASGGPVLDLKGRVVGISTAIVGTSQGLGIAIPSSLAARVISELERHGQVAHSSLDVEVVDDAGASRPKGAVRVVSIVPGGAAEAAHLAIGEQIVALDGKRLRGAADFRMRIFQAAPGTQIRAEISGGSKSIVRLIESRGLSARATSP